jgi:hypothetical protein
MVTSTSTPGSKLILVWWVCKTNVKRGGLEEKAHNLFDNLTRGVEINETLVDFEFITVPCFGTLTARLGKERSA